MLAPVLRIRHFAWCGALRAARWALPLAGAMSLGDSMAQDPPAQDQMHYEAMAQEALRGVVKAALRKAALPEGLPGAHHFYITFKTEAPGVSGPADLLGKYPDEMTIVLQHQYWDLAPGETFFSVTLKFGGQPKRLSVPYAALTRFYDPSVQFLLQFEAPAAQAGAVQAAPAEAETATPPADPDAPNVVSLDHFRKK
jgi:hypothetical protein